MSTNRPNDNTPSTNKPSTTGSSSSSTGTGTGSSNIGGSTSGASDTGTTGAGSLTRGTTSTGSGTGAATAPAGTSQQYREKFVEGASRAKDYVSEKASAVGEKFQDLRNKDYGQMAEDAKQYARQNPGQALLISAAAGFLLGLLLRGSRR